MRNRVEDETAAPAQDPLSRYESHSTPMNCVTLILCVSVGSPPNRVWDRGFSVFGNMTQGTGVRERKRETQIEGCWSRRHTSWLSLCVTAAPSCKIFCEALWNVLPKLSEERGGSLVHRFLWSYPRDINYLPCWVAHESTPNGFHGCPPHQDVRRL